MLINKYMYVLLRLNVAYSGSPIQTAVAITVPVVSVLLLLIAILLCIFKQQKAKRRAIADVRGEDVNPTYGDYFDPDPRMEVEDTNAYYSSDFEAGRSRATDNNPYDEY